jgi:hypothetical protein
VLVAATLRIHIPNVDYVLDSSAVEVLVEELENLERPRATIVARTLRNPSDPYEPTDEDIVELARALDHLRNLGTLPPDDRDDVFGPTGLRGNLVDRFAMRTYRLDPHTGEQPFESMSWGPLYGKGDRFVDTWAREWLVEWIEPDTDPIEIVVAPWRPRAERV